VASTFDDLYGLAYRLVGNEHDAADVVQEAYLRAFRGMKSFRGEASFRTWAYRITANCAANFLAERARHPHVELDETAPVRETRVERDPEEVAGSGDDRRRLVAALSTLPEPLRLVVVLRDVYDLPHAVVARELGISQSAAKVRLHRARRRLRDALFENGVSPPTAGSEAEQIEAVGMIVGLTRTDAEGVRRAV
jgi:RNA polymerase sigma-70 factor (ECF subfamily)